jgi:hypothetical protein
VSSAELQQLLGVCDASPDDGISLDPGEHRLCVRGLTSREQLAEQHKRIAEEPMRSLHGNHETARIDEDWGDTFV